MRRLVASFYYELNGGLFTFYETKVEEISHFVLVHYVLLDAYGIFLGEMHRHMSHEEEQKILFCCSQVVLA